MSFNSTNFNPIEPTLSSSEYSIVPFYCFFPVTIALILSIAFIKCDKKKNILKIERLLVMIFSVLSALVFGLSFYTSYFYRSVDKKAFFTVWYSGIAYFVVMFLWILFVEFKLAFNEKPARFESTDEELPDRFNNIPYIDDSISEVAVVSGTIQQSTLPDTVLDINQIAIVSGTNQRFTSPDTVFDRNKRAVVSKKFTTSGEIKAKRPYIIMNGSNIISIFTITASSIILFLNLIFILHNLAYSGSGASFEDVNVLCRDFYMILLSVYCVLTLIFPVYECYLTRRQSYILEI